MDTILEKVRSSTLCALLANLNQWLWRLWGGSAIANAFETFSRVIRQSAIASLFIASDGLSQSLIARWLRGLIGETGEIAPAAQWEKALVAFILFFVPIELWLITKLPPSTKYLGDLVILILALSLLLRLRRAHWPLSRTPADFPVLALVGVAVLSTLWNGVPLSIAGFGIRAYVEYYLLYLVLAYLPWKERERRNLILWFLVYAVVIAALGDLQAILHVATSRQWLSAAEQQTTRAFGTMDNPNTFAGFVVLVLTMLLSLVVTRVHAGIRTLALLAMIVAVPALLFSLSREALIAFSLSALMIAVVADRRFLLLMILAAVTIPVVDPHLVQRFTYAFSQGYVSTSAQYGRLLYWTKGFEVLQGHFVLGTGPGRFGGSVAHLFGSPVYAAYGLGEKPIIDSQWVQTMAELGAAGFIAYIALAFAAVRTGIRLYRHDIDPFWRALGLALAGGTVAFFAQSIFASLLETHQVVVVFWLLFGMAAWRLRQSSTGVREPFVQSG